MKKQNKHFRSFKINTYFPGKIQKKQGKYNGGVFIYIVSECFIDYFSSKIYY